jgi:hypothetical protein
MKRREFITLIGGAAVASSPLGARAQQDASMRRIGVLLHTDEADLEMRARLAGFDEGLERLG